MGANNILVKMFMQLAFVGFIVYYFRGTSIDQVQGWFEPKNILKYVMSSMSSDNKPPPVYQAYIKGLTTFYLAYYLLFVQSVPKLLYKKTDFNEELIRRTQVLGTKKFRPAPWFPVALLQTYGYSLLSELRLAWQDPASNYDREKKMTKKGHGITLDRMKEEGKVKLGPGNPIFVVVTDSPKGSHAYEVITFAEAVQKMGFHVYVLNMRGHGNAPLHREKKGDPPTFNTISGCDDLREAIQFVLKKPLKLAKDNNRPGPLIALASFGTAATIVCNYLKEEGKRASVAGAVCISPALKLESLAKPHWFYSMMEMKWLKNYILQVHYDAIDKAVSMPEAQAASTVAEFHERVTMKMNGDEPDDSVGYADYLKLHSITNNDYLADDIEIPLLFLCSKSDKYFRFAEVMPREEVCTLISKHEHAILCMVDRAGHGCFFEGISCSNWASRVAGEFVISLSEMRDAKAAERKRLA